MSTRMFRQFYTGIVRPLVTPKAGFPPASSTANNLGSSKKKPDNEKTMTILKVIGGFFPGVFVGHYLGKDKITESENSIGKNKKDRGKDVRETNHAPAPDGIKGESDNATESVNDAVEGVKDKAKDMKDSMMGNKGKGDAKDKDMKDKAKDAKETAKDKAEDAKDTAKDKAEEAKDKAKDVKEDAKDKAEDAKDSMKD